MNAQLEMPTSDQAYTRICQNHVRLMRLLLQNMTNESRTTIFERLTKGYCRSCGKQVRDSFICQCENDE